jgi:predicted metal-binding protein
MESFKLDELSSLFESLKMDDYRFIDPNEIEFGEWVRMKCMYGCSHYGKGAMCPPNTPPVSECKAVINEYSKVVLVRFSGAVEKKEDRHAWTREINESLLELERDAFFLGFYKAFVLFVDPCNFCDECQGERTLCMRPVDCRPSPEGFGIDVFATARSVGFPIDVLTDYTETMNRYGFLLVS